MFKSVATMALLYVYVGQPVITLHCWSVISQKRERERMSDAKGTHNLLANKRRHREGELILKDWKSLIALAVAVDVVLTCST